MKKRVLVVDDDSGSRELLSRLLARAGYEVRVAGTGEEGLTVLADFVPDLLLCDKNLPRMHGAEVIAQARKKLPHLAVILITAFPEPFSLGPERLNGYLAKPFKTLKAVEEAVAQALESADDLKRREELRA